MIKPKLEKKCAECGEIFRPYRTTDKYCSLNCKLKSKQDQEKKPVKFYTINKVSERRKSINSKYERLKKGFLSLPENKYCKIKGTNCTHLSTTIEHSAGRIGKNLTDVSNWIASCSNCNLELETNTELSRKHQLSRFHDGKKIEK